MAPSSPPLASIFSKQRGVSTLASEPIISVSGLRGIIGQTLTPEVAIRYASSFAAQLPPGPLVITRDGRATGRMLADVIRGALCGMGREVIDADVAATPTTGVLVRDLQAIGGIQISASHNPPEYNGMKLFSREGRVISDAAGQPVLAAYRSGQTPSWVSHDQVGHVVECGDTLEAHFRLVCATVDVEAIRERRFRVLLDSNHGAGSLLGRKLLEHLNCDCTILGTPPDGQFEHTPEPTAENLQGISSRVVDAGAAVGFCQDPDADRLALIDENGRYVGEEFTLAICVDHVLQRTPGPIVTNCSTSRMSQDLAEKYGVPFFHAKVGEANVTAEMIARKAVFGGEGNGGPIDPRVGFVRDSFVGMAMTLDRMAQTGQPLSQIVDALPQYAIHKTKVSVAADQIPAALDKLEQHFRDAQASRMDGLRLDWPGRWLLVRGSNTEPIVRLIAEASDAAVAEELCLTAAQVLG
ncbi:MAG: phosphoglucosamine mutase [Planctomycetales bacterium]|nr:phosphoglucosamine mutase [Planctomycetales bacterium]